MNKIRSFVDRLIDYYSRQLSNKKVHRTVMSLAVVVIFITTYALILPAITLDQKSGKDLPGLSLEGGASANSESDQKADKEALHNQDDSTDEDPGFVDKKKKNTKDKEDKKVIRDEDSDGKDKAVSNQMDTSADRPDQTSGLKTYEFDGGDYLVTATLKNDIRISDGTRLLVKEYKAGIGKFQPYYSIIRSEASGRFPGTSVKKLSLYEVAFVDPDGNTIGGVKADITITYKKGINLEPTDMARGVLFQGKSNATGSAIQNAETEFARKNQ